MNILDRFTKLSIFLENKGWILRSGGACGADLAFEKEVTRKQIFLPWKNFNQNTSNLFEIPLACFEIASNIIPYWNHLTEPIKRLHARNVQQVLGLNLDSPSEFFVYWTPNGEVTGGTGTAIKLAIMNNIPIFNFANENDDYKLWQFLKNKN